MDYPPSQSDNQQEPQWIERSSNPYQPFQPTYPQAQWQERPPEQYQAPPYPPQKLYSGYMPLERRNHAATIGFWCGIASLVIFLGFLTGNGGVIVLCMLLGLCLSVIGIVFSSLGFRAASKRAMTIIGLILSILTSIIYLLFIIAVIVVAMNMLRPH